MTDGPARTGAPSAGATPRGPSAAIAALADAVDALLPQTQCAKCGFDGCRPYAEAIAGGQAQIDRCPPGGAAGIARLARLLGRPELPLNPECGTESPRRVAWIDPALCIGCTKCIQACPVDAIVGARRRMHTVAESSCTGCDLCVAPCPVDCIAMLPLPEARRGWSDDDAAAARSRHRARGLRLACERQRRQQRLAARGAAPQPQDGHDQDAQTRKRAVIEAAMRRARERLQGTPR
jgi:electron transport complex protein RnfB